MYRIKADRRTERSAERIYNGLDTCLASKQLRDISVSDICQASGVGRSTFYRIFDRIDDVLLMKCDRCFKEVLHGFVEVNGDKPFERLNLVRFYLEYWLDNWKVLDNVLKANRHDIVYQSHLKHSLIIAQKYNPNPGLSLVERRYLLAMRTGQTVSVLSAWIDGGRRESIEELFSILKKILK